MWYERRPVQKSSVLLWNSGPVPVQTFDALFLVQCDRDDCGDFYDNGKDTMNCPEKVMKTSHFNQTNQRILSILR